MESLYIIIPVILILVTVVVAAFIWAVNKNQFDDLESPSQDIIFDDRQSHAASKAPASDNDHND